MDATPPAPVFRTDLSFARRRSARTLAFGATATVHAIAVVVAAAVLNWHQPGAADPHIASAPLIVALHAFDTSSERPRAGASTLPSIPARIITPVKAVAPALQPLTAPLDTGDLAPIADQGGRKDAMSQEAHSWRRAIMERLEAQRFYPGAALRQDWQGSGAVLFRIERSGRLLDIRLADSTGRAALDAAALNIVARAAPFPAIPQGLPDEMAITMPVQFLIGPASPALAALP